MAVGHTADHETGNHAHTADDPEQEGNHRYVTEESEASLRQLTGTPSQRSRGQQVSGRGVTDQDGIRDEVDRVVRIGQAVAPPCFGQDATSGSRAASCRFSSSMRRRMSWRRRSAMA